jgi:hypothetical protein
MGDPILRHAEIGTRTVRAIGGLHFIAGNAAPYFSLTMESRSRNREDQFGAQHDELTRIWPELAPLAALHLSSIDGVPMHAASNGLYYVQHLIPGASGRSRFNSSFATCPHSTKVKIPDECTQTMADHFRISLNEARGLLVALTVVAEGVGHYERVWGEGSGKVVQAAMAAWVEAQKPRWRAEADACIASLGLVVYGDRWPLTA